MQNVMGSDLAQCGCRPMTGWRRNGSCETGPEDSGSHTVCAVMTDEFLEFSKSRGNDLSTPHPEFGFPGLRKGDRWCLCAARWLEAYRVGKGPAVVLEATHEAALEICPMEALMQHALTETETAN